MSVDKFGRSSASITRRSVLFVPSRRQLQGAGALCKTDDYVDFKKAFARNLSMPVEEKDATTKEYVDKFMASVKAAAEKKVEASLKTVIEKTHELSKKYFDEKQQSLNLGFKVIIDSSVKEHVDKKMPEIKKEITETKQLVQDYKSIAEANTISASEQFTNFTNELTSFKGRLNTQDGKISRVEEAYTHVVDRVKVLEDIPRPPLPPGINLTTAQQVKRKLPASHIQASVPQAKRPPQKVQPKKAQVIKDKKAQQTAKSSVIPK